MSFIKKALWSMLDPLLWKIRSRIVHLERQNPPNINELWSDRAIIDKTAKIYAEAVIENYGQIDSMHLGAFSHVRGNVSVISPDGKLFLGHHSFVGPGSRIWSQGNITIGNYVLISHLVDIHDTDAHSLDINLRRMDSINLFEKNIAVDWSVIDSKPVCIEDDVWIGFKSTILKGVTIGKGSVIAANSVVRSNIPPYTIVAGNPAKIIGRPGFLDPEDDLT